MKKSTQATTATPTTTVSCNWPISQSSHPCPLLGQKRTTTVGTRLNYRLKNQAGFGTTLRSVPMSCTSATAGFTSSLLPMVSGNAMLSLSNAARKIYSYWKLACVGKTASLNSSTSISTGTTNDRTILFSMLAWEHRNACCHPKSETIPALFSLETNEHERQATPSRNFGPYNNLLTGIRMMRLFLDA